jgi:hypothetical protein
LVEKRVDGKEREKRVDGEGGKKLYVPSSPQSGSLFVPSTMALGLQLSGGRPPGFPFV